MSPTSPHSTADFKAGELFLPAYATLRPDGVFINISRLPPEGVMLFVERLFAGGARFEGLDYSCFTRLLYGTGAEAPAKIGAAEVKLANGIVRFNPQRRTLYKGVKIINDGERAEYLFEPVAIEIAMDEPVYGEAEEAGVRPIIRYERKTRLQPTQLNLDEFIADMWVKGVRFGIDVKAVREAIENGGATRVEIALQREPTSGKDAELQEESDALRRDNSPKIMLNGMADLRRFTNRFPQIAKDMPLLRKIPRVLGEPGCRVTGQIIEPPLPADFDLQKLAGPGTRIERRGTGEVIVASMDGFLAFDTRSNHIAITEKVENRGGVSVRTTGDLSLSVDEYVEHGEVQEGRVIEGRHMTFLSDVFGTVISENGDIQIKKNLSGGRAQGNGGNITILGNAYNASMEARCGRITVSRAESCTIIGKIVSIEHAVNCEIVAEELQLGDAEGCAIAGTNVRLASSDALKDRETIISMLTPDFPGFYQQVTLLMNKASEIGKGAQTKEREIQAASADPEFAKYLNIVDMIKAGTIKLTVAQQNTVQQLAMRFAQPARALNTLIAEKNQLMESRKTIEQEIALLSEQCERSADCVQCEIGRVLGDTIVRKLPTNMGVSLFHNLPGHELKTRLRQLGEPRGRIFSECTGSVKWHCQPPEKPAA